MTHIRGTITKIKEIEKDAFTEPVGAGSPSPHYFAYGIATGTSYVDLFTATTSGHTIILKGFNISCYSVSINRIYFVKMPDGTALGDFNFYISQDLKFSLGDVSIADSEYVRMYMQERGAGSNWYGTVWYIDVPPET